MAIEIYNTDLPSMDVPKYDLGAMDDYAGEGLIEISAGKTAAVHGEKLEIDQATRLAIQASRCIDASETRQLAGLIGRLPTPIEAVHMLIGGASSQWHLIPAILAIATPAVIDELVITTLTYSKQNVIDLCALMDAGKIRKLTIVCSHYFSVTSKHIYEPSVVLFAERGAEVLVPRSHAKILLIRLDDGRQITAEGSANLRSAQTVEQVTLFGDPAVYQFHADWIARLPRESHAEPT